MSNQYIDFAGFPPYIRGNYVLSEFPKFISDKAINSLPLYWIQTQWNDVTLKEKIKKAKQREDTSQAVGVILNFSSDNPMQSIALIRALRGAWYLLSKEKLTILIQVNENDLPNLAFILACQCEWIVCCDKVEAIINRYKNFLFARTIDPFGGDSYLESITYQKIEELIN